MFSNFRVLIIISCAITLAACGGGSGGDKPNPSTSSSSSIANSSVTNSSTSSNSSQGFTAPKNLSVKPGNSTVTLTWNTVAGATSYHVYYATEPDILSKNISAFQNGTWIKDVNTPHTVTGLENNKTYYFVVTAVNANSESGQSFEVSAVPTTETLADQPNAQEVLVLELINRARFDPSAEATRYGIGLNDGITGTQITADRKAPLAINILLTKSARTHSQWMLDQDIFSHTGANGSTATDRMAAAAYTFTGSWSSGENIAWYGTTGSNINLTEYAFLHHEGLFKSPGHRVNILGTSFRELGVGQKQGNFLYNGTNYLASMLTENFAKSGSPLFLTGVIYADTNGNKFYDVGEGLDGVTISTNDKSYPVYATGAYSIPLSNGTYDLVITGAPFAEEINYRVQINNVNFKLDVVKNNAGTNVVTWQ